MRKAFTIASAAIMLLAATGQEILYAQSKRVVVYYAAWTRFNTHPITINMIDFSQGTHWIIFTMVPQADGTFDGGSSIDAATHAQFVNAAHAAGSKAILGTGGWGTDYSGAAGTYRATSIAFLTNLMRTYGYDGVDIDWEHIPTNQYNNFSAWIRDLKAAILQVRSDGILTAAMGLDQAVIQNAQYFDQINQMSYDYSGPYPGWISWHNSPIYNGGYTFPSTGGPLPAIDLDIQATVAAGVPASKINIGIEFYGYIWNGVTGPRQSGFGTVRHTVPYYEIMDTYGGLQLQWDPVAQAGYYSTSSQFVSFDAETTVVAKAEYINQKGLGGIMIYEYAGGYRFNAPAGYRDSFMKTIKRTFLGGTSSGDTTPPTVSMTAPASNASVANTVTLTATASDNVGVVGVQFLVDGKTIGDEQTGAPYTTTYNTWQLANGTHTFSASARDWSGNRSTATSNVTVANSGTPPVIPDLVVYNNSLQSPFQDASWGATATYGATGPGKNGTSSIQIAYSAWGGYDILSGTWSVLVPIDPTVYDSLKFDVYPTSSFPLAVGFYNGVDINVTGLPLNTWTSVSIPTPASSFTRFYIQNNTGSAQTAYLDNIRFSGKQFASGIQIPPVTLPGAGDYSLGQNYPNPFNPATTIEFSLGERTRATLKVYDILGKEVAVLADDILDAGSHRVVFDASRSGSLRGGLPSGVYFYRLVTGSFAETKRLTLMK